MCREIKVSYLRIFAGIGGGGGMGKSGVVQICSHANVRGGGVGGGLGGGGWGGGGWGGGWQWRILEGGFFPGGGKFLPFRTVVQKEIS